MDTAQRKRSRAGARARGRAPLGGARKLHFPECRAPPPCPLGSPARSAGPGTSGRARASAGCPSERGWRGAGAERVWRLGLRGERGHRGNPRVVIPPALASAKGGLAATSPRAPRGPGRASRAAQSQVLGVPGGRAACGASPRRGSRGSGCHRTRRAGERSGLSSQLAPGRAPDVRTHFGVPSRLPGLHGPDDGVHGGKLVTFLFLLAVLTLVFFRGNLRSFE